MSDSSEFQTYDPEFAELKATTPDLQNIASAQNSGNLLVRSVNENDLRLIRIFRTVAEAGGLTAAELKLNMERSTISRHVQALEARLGGPVCVRGPSGFELTDLGHHVMRAAVVASEALDQVKEVLNLANGVVSGDLHLGIADNCLTNPRFRISETIARLREIAPEVTLHLSIGSPAALLDDVMSRKLQLCITGACILPQYSEHITSDPIFTEDFKLYFSASATKPSLSVSDLMGEGYGMVVRDIESRSHKFATRLGISNTAQADGLEAVATLISSGRFAGFLPTHYADTLKNTCPLQEVKGAEEYAYVVHFFLAWDNKRAMAAQTKLFSDLISTAHRITGQSGKSH